MELPADVTLEQLRKHVIDLGERSRCGPIEDDELHHYADAVVTHLRGVLASGELSVNADVVTDLKDLRCVVIRFDEPRNRSVRFTNSEHNVKSRWVGIHFAEDRCFVVKLIYKKFWAGARARDDARSILGELCRGGHPRETYVRSDMEPCDGFQE